MFWRKSWLKPDYGDPQQRYIFVDGAPYDGGPDGANPIRRAFQTPTLKGTAIAGLFMATVTALCASPNARGPLLLWISAAFPYAHVLLHRAGSKIRRQEYPSLKNVVIDKTGRALPDPHALSFVDDYYRRQIRGSAGFVVLMPPLMVGIGTVANLAIGASQWKVAGVEALVTAFCVIPHVSQLGWALYARHQLNRPDRPWTVTTDPPPLRKVVNAPEHPGLSSALVPAHVRALPASTR